MESSKDTAASKPPVATYSAITRSAYQSAPPVSAGPNMSCCSSEKRHVGKQPKDTETSASQRDVNKARAPPRPARLLGLTSSSPSVSSPLHVRAGHQEASWAARREELTTPPQAGQT